MEETFWEANGDWISAAISIGVAVLIAVVVDRFLIGRAESAAEKMETAQFSREARTRLRLIRRLVFVAIILIGAALALSQFTEIRRLATGLLASTAVLGLVLGFAGRTVIANFVAGVLMAIRQPIRIGDLISLGEEVHGRVVDIALTYTSVDRGDGSLLVVPNEKVVNEVVVNHSAGNPRAPVTVEIVVPAYANLGRARKALEASEVTSVQLIEVAAEGAKLELKASVDPGRDREARAAEMREAAQTALREASVLREP
jgi:small-conductance mechanosensitive channel